MKSTNTGDRIERASSMLGPLARRDVPLAPLTTYKVGGRAALMVHPRSVADLAVIATVVAETELPTLVVGRGSNLLIADAGYNGIAIMLDEMVDDRTHGHRVDGTQITARASLALPQLARRLVADGLAGFEWAVGVPGSVGGAVRMNAGGHGSDMRECLIEAWIFDLRTNCSAWVATENLGMRFRGSDLASHQIVVEARLQLSHGDRETSQQLIDEVVRWRREKQPGGQNAGSVFVNPIPGELAAGELIDRVGLRGHRLGSASVSSKHANFIQASEGGSSDDVVALIDFVRRRVADETGFALRSEVRLIGFDDAPIDDEVGILIGAGQ